ncbi:hypothetical protein LNQ52_27890 [Klebsiella pneumoniae subsp. pneumoniae]|nr:hypothetical protein [Klebsiella pneumoniae subsp. pneumoniae]
MVGFEELATGQDRVALVYGDISGAVAGPRPRTFRVFDGRCPCLACAVIAAFSWKRPCRISLKKVGGILLYHRQEGRNIGLLNTIPAPTALQDQGYDTVEANHQLGFAADERDFTLCADMFKLLNVEQVRLANQ